MENNFLNIFIEIFEFIWKFKKEKETQYCSKIRMKIEEEIQ
jgi:hypothetical protein